MTLTKTPICNFGEKAKNFDLISTDNKKISLNDVKGKRRFTTILEPRWLCWHIYRMTKEYSLEDIGWTFQRDHTSIMNGLSQLKEKHPKQIKIYEEYYRAEKEKEKELD